MPQVAGMRPIVGMLELQIGTFGSNLCPGGGTGDVDPNFVLPSQLHEPFATVDFTLRRPPAHLVKHRLATGLPDRLTILRDGVAMGLSVWVLIAISHDETTYRHQHHVIKIFVANFIKKTLSASDAVLVVAIRVEINAYITPASTHQIRRYVSLLN